MSREQFLNHKRRLRYIVDRNLFLLTKRANERPFVGRQGLYYFLLSRAGTYTFWGRYYLGEVPHPRWGTKIKEPNVRIGRRYLQVAEDLRSYTRRCARFIDLMRDHAVRVRSRELKEEDELFSLKEKVYDDKVAERDFVEEMKVALHIKYPMMRDLIEDMDWYAEKIDQEIKKLEQLINEEKGVYRISAVMMFYATEIKRYTPIPFAEFRVWTLTRNPNKYSKKKLVDALKRMIRLFDSVRIAFERGRAYAGDYEGNVVARKMDEISVEIVGFEMELIDEDEIVPTFMTTGLPRDEWKYDAVYRYACFFRNEREYKVPKETLRRFIPGLDTKDVRIQYNEAKIRSIEGRR